MVPGEAPAFNNLLFLPIILVVILTAILIVYTIFQYKNRPLQIKLSNVGVLACIALILAIFFLYIPMIEKKIGIIPDYRKSFGIYMPLVSLVFMVMANRAIKRDENLVKSADRLR
jgi:glucan phosphoethanolaminetransferase (alkaline phosphatase superfamily)